MIRNLSEPFVPDLQARTEVMWSFPLTLLLLLLLWEPGRVRGRPGTQEAEPG